MKTTVSSKRQQSAFTVYIGGLPHLRFSLETYMGFQSWLWTQPRGSFARDLCDSPSYEIDIYFSNMPPIHLEYDEEKTWREILLRLEQA